MLGGLTVEGRPLEPLQLIALASFLSRSKAQPAPFAGRAHRSRSWTPSSNGRRPSNAKSQTSAARSIRRARSWTMPRRSCAASATACGVSARGCAARSSRTSAARTRRNTSSSRSSPIAMAATCSSCGPSTAPAIPGIVHGSSGSGASLYLEPLSTVEINNDIVALEQQEHEEVRRILLALSDAFRAAPKTRTDGRRRRRARRAECEGAFLASRRAASSRSWRRTADSSCARRDIRC